MKRLLFLICLSGCSQGTFEFREHQELFGETVWHGFFKKTEMPPPVEWRTPECGLYKSVSGTYKYWGVWSYNVRSGKSADEPGETCRGGFYWLGGGVVVAQYPDDPTDWDTLIHEYIHAKAWLDFRGDADPLHNRLPWDELVTETYFDWIDVLKKRRG